MLSCMHYSLVFEGLMHFAYCVDHSATLQYNLAMSLVVPPDDENYLEKFELHR
jgi:hypothetical protein